MFKCGLPVTSEEDPTVFCAQKHFFAQKYFFEKFSPRLWTPSERPFYMDTSNWQTHFKEIKGNWLPTSFKGIFNSETNSAE
jgi:hypothetical protein